jgi:hypothetical protein
MIGQLGHQYLHAGGLFSQARRIATNVAKAAGAVAETAPSIPAPVCRASQMPLADFGRVWALVKG